MKLKDLQWEFHACDWCGSTSEEILFEGPDWLENLPGKFRMVRCNKCGLYRQNPRLEWASLQHYYPKNYASFLRLLKEEKNRIKKLIKRFGNWKRRRAIEKYQKSGRLLDVGCGTGRFLEEMIRSGKWDVSGIEPNPDAATYVKKNLGITIIKSRLEDTQLEEKYFDVITFWDVFEHLENPFSELKYASSLLKDNGWLVITIPYTQSLSKRIFKEYWVGWDLPRHLYLFPNNTLEIMLGQLGFTIASKKHIANEYSLFGMSLKFWSQSWKSKYPKLNEYLVKIYDTPFAQLLLTIPFAIIGKLNLSTGLTIFAQKKPTQ